MSAGPNLRWYDKLRYKYHGRLEWTAIDCGVRLMSPAAAGFSTMDVLVQGPELPDFESLAHNTDHSLVQSGLLATARCLRVTHSVGRLGLETVGLAVDMVSDVRHWDHTAESNPHGALTFGIMRVDRASTTPKPPAAPTSGGGTGAPASSAAHGRPRSASSSARVQQRVVEMLRDGIINAEEMAAILAADGEFRHVAGVPPVDGRDSPVGFDSQTGTAPGPPVVHHNYPLCFFPYCDVSVRFHWRLRRDAAADSGGVDHYVQRHPRYRECVRNGDGLRLFRARELGMRTRVRVSPATDALRAKFAPAFGASEWDVNDGSALATNMSTSTFARSTAGDTAGRPCVALCWGVMPRLLRILTAMRQLPPPLCPAVRAVYPHTFAELLFNTDLRVEGSPVRLAWWQSRTHQVGFVVDVSRLAMRYVGAKVASQARAARAAARADISVPPPPVPKVTAFRIDVERVSGYRAGMDRHVSTAVAASGGGAAPASGGKSVSFAPSHSRRNSSIASAPERFVHLPRSTSSGSLQRAAGRASTPPRSVSRSPAPGGGNSPFLPHRPLHPLVAGVGPEEFFAGASRVAIGTSHLAPDIDAPQASMEETTETPTPSGDTSNGNGHESDSSDWDGGGDLGADSDEAGYHSDDSDDDALPPPHVVVTDLKLLWTTDIRDMAMDFGAAFTQVVWNHRHEFTRFMYVGCPWLVHCTPAITHPPNHRVRGLPGTRASLCQH